MSTAFVRQLGAESGVQLNPLRDNSEIPSQDNSDQVFGIMMRATRGRIDKPFAVDRGNVFKRLGRGEPVRVSALNKAWVHVVEAVNNGAYQAIVQRLSTENAKIKYLVASVGAGAILTATVSAGAVTAVEVTAGGSGYLTVPTITIGGPGTGAQVSVTVADGAIATASVVAPGSGYTVAPEIGVSSAYSFAAQDELPESAFFFALKHLECFNDGIKVQFRAEEKTEGGMPVENGRIALRVLDRDDIALFEFEGSLDPDAKDDYGNTAYLPDLISGQTDAIEFYVGAIRTVQPDSEAYGYDSNFFPKWASSPVIVCFEEGGTGYTTQDYMRSRELLQYTPFNYAYISAGDTESPALLAQLAQLAFDTNRQLRFDVPGNLGPEAAIAFVEQLNMGANQTAHLLHAFWSPLKSDDPTGVNGKGYFGTATLNIAYACGRNAQTDTKGFAPKNYPVAGREWPLRRTRVTQTYTPRDQELNALARAKINPVMWEVYTGGGRYVFRDSLTCALVDNSLKKLISVADMSSSIDDAVTRFNKDTLQLPMEVAVKRMRDYLKVLFDGATTAGWLVASADPAMVGMSYRYDVRPNEQRPYDRMDVSYWLRFDGVARQIFTTQTLNR